jgi:hypothetical protein
MRRTQVRQVIDGTALADRDDVVCAVGARQAAQPTGRAVLRQGQAHIRCAFGPPQPSRTPSAAVLPGPVRLTGASDGWGGGMGSCTPPAPRGCWVGGERNAGRRIGGGRPPGMAGSRASHPARCARCTAPQLQMCRSGWPGSRSHSCLTRTPVEVCPPCQMWPQYGPARYVSGTVRACLGQAAAFGLLTQHRVAGLGHLGDQLVQSDEQQLGRVPRLVPVTSSSSWYADASRGVSTRPALTSWRNSMSRCIDFTVIIDCPQSCGYPIERHIRGRCPFDDDTKPGV